MHGADAPFLYVCRHEDGIHHIPAKVISNHLQYGYRLVLPAVGHVGLVQHLVIRVVQRLERLAATHTHVPSAMHGCFLESVATPWVRAASPAMAAAWCHAAVLVIGGAMSACRTVTSTAPFSAPLCRGQFNNAHILRAAIALDRALRTSCTTLKTLCKWTCPHTPVLLR